MRSVATIGKLLRKAGLMQNARTAAPTAIAEDTVGMSHSTVRAGWSVSIVCDDATFIAAGSSFDNPRFASFA